MSLPVEVHEQSWPSRIGAGVGVGFAAGVCAARGQSCCWVAAASQLLAGYGMGCCSDASGRACRLAQQKAIESWSHVCQRRKLLTTCHALL